MNRQVKAKLATLIEELEEIAGLEAKAVNRHTKAGNTDYAAHAAWCVEGIHEAIMLLANRFPADALAVMRRIVDSSPDDLSPWKNSSKPETLSGLCADGACNHPSHL